MAGGVRPLCGDGQVLGKSPAVKNCGTILKMRPVCAQIYLSNQDRAAVLHAWGCVRLRHGAVALPQ
jgi:hypothetical protein